MEKSYRVVILKNVKVDCSLSEVKLIKERSAS